MLFHSFDYFVLFGITAVVYWRLASVPLRTAWLVLASIVFYGSWSVPLTAVVVGTAAFDYMAALRIEAAATATARRAWLAASLSVSLGLLAFFKYSNFILDSAWSTGLLDGAAPHLALILPLGISFYTFETISYVVDVYHGRIRAERRLANYALFLLFFPHLIAGPIVRAGHFLPQIDRPKRLRLRRLYIAAWIFTSGLAKKAVIADQLALVVDPVFRAPAEFAPLALWTASLAYTAQIYCDFSGYSDMAVGSALALGFRLPRNFRRPFTAPNVAELWRRWHVTLAYWLRDYVYRPLGGSRGGRGRTALNLFLTLTVSGLWHGAAWRFVLWGAFHGSILAAHRLVPWPAWTSAPLLLPLRVGTTVLTFVLGLVVFRAHSLDDALLMLGRMLSPNGWDAGLSLAPALTALVLGVVSLAWLAHLAASQVSGPRLERRLSPAVAGAGLGLLFVLIQLLIPATSGAFIYFQF